MLEAIILDQYTAARAYFASVIGLLLLESFVHTPVFQWLKYKRASSKSSSKHNYASVTLHKTLLIHVPIPWIDYCVADLIRFLVFAALNVAFAINHNEYTTDYKLYGWLTISNAGLALLMAARSNLFSVLLRIPSPVLLFYHRWIGIATVAHATVHISYNIQHYIKTDQIESSFINARIRIGLMSWLCLAFIFLTSLPIVRRKFFEVFYYTHALFFIFMVGALVHTTNGPEFLLPGFFLWVADRAIRFAYNFRKLAVENITHFEGDLTKIEIKGISVKNTAQVAWVQIPNVSFLNWHPFTIMPAPGDETDRAIISVRGLGHFTRTVQKSISQDKSTQSDSGQSRKQRQVRIDGPYGVGRIPWSKFPVVALVAGGIGITPSLSIVYHLKRLAMAGSQSKQKQNSPSLVRNVHLLWVVKQTSHIKWFERELRDLMTASNDVSAPFNLQVTIHITGGGGREIEMNDVSKTFRDDDPWTTKSGRPSLQAWIGDIKQQHSSSDIALNVCGPRSLSRTARQEAVHQSCRDGLICFEAETFEL